MAEILRHKESYTSQPEKAPSGESKALIHELERRAHEASVSQQEQLRKAQSEVLEHAEVSEEYLDQLHNHSKQEAVEHYSHVDDNLKDITYNRALRSVQARLRGPEKTFSTVIHKPVVDFASEGLSKTAARKYGLLGAGVIGFFGSGLLLLLARKYGFTYSYFAVFGLLAIGYVIGLLIELAIAARHKA